MGILTSAAPKQPQRATGSGTEAGRIEKAHGNVLGWYPLAALGNARIWLMWHNPKNYYQIFKTDHEPGHRPEMVAEVKGQGNAQLRVETLMRGRTKDEQHISYYMSNYSSSRRQMPR